MRTNDKDGLKPGIYELPVNGTVSRMIEKAKENGLRAKTGEISGDDTGLLFSHARNLLREALRILETEKEESSERVAESVHLANRVAETLSEELARSVPEAADHFDCSEIEPAKPRKLLEVSEPSVNPLAVQTDLPRPRTGFSESSFFTGIIPSDPQLFQELKLEIASADSIDLLMSFVRWNGLQMLMPELEAFASRGGKIRVLTTCYIGATDAKAVDALAKLSGAEVRVEYDGRGTRLHAKSWIFKRASGFGTAYMGSSNMSRVALSTGLEWNVKVTQQDLANVFKKAQVAFEKIWESRNYQRYEAGKDKEKLIKALTAAKADKSGIKIPDDPAFWPDIRPYDFQQEILDALSKERDQGRTRNLVIAATGTGKTMIAAFDFRRFRAKYPKAKLLFLAHRKEILVQAHKAFQFVLRDPKFGGLLVDGETPGNCESLFASVQTMNSGRFYEKFAKNWFDFIVVDEAHHIAAKSYEGLMKWFEPQILLGMTATPERMDGGDPKQYFGGRFAAEIRLPDAIERGLLAPFHYYVADDPVDLSGVPFRAGRYDEAALEKALVGTRDAELRSMAVIDELNSRTADRTKLRAIAFCAGVKHAEWMCEQFHKAGFKVRAVSGKTGSDERRQIQRDLQSGELQMVTTADLYNEGVDIPAVNTVLFLRPTESLTVFLQQLGRGLRLSPETEKDCLNVLDFVGQVNQNYAGFESKFRALLANTRGGIEGQICAGFPGLPNGCYVELREKAREIVLKSIRSACRKWQNFALLLQDDGENMDFRRLLSCLHLTPYGFYSKSSKLTFSLLLRKAAGESALPPEKGTPEAAWASAAARVSMLSAKKMTEFLIGWIQSGMRKINLKEREKTWIWMFYRTVYSRSAYDKDEDGCFRGLAWLLGSDAVRSEVLQLLQILSENANSSGEFIFENSAIERYGRYSLDAIYAAFTRTGGTVAAGVRHFKELKTDVFFVTFQKKEKDFTPETRYDDYLMGNSRMHWQSQYSTGRETAVGQRYLSQPSGGTHIQIFCRAFKNQSGNAAAYTALGEADYESDSGDFPMNFVWKLRHEVPAAVIRELSEGIPEQTGVI